MDFYTLALLSVLPVKISAMYVSLTMHTNSLLIMSPIILVMIQDSLEQCPTTSKYALS